MDLINPLGFSSQFPTPIIFLEKLWTCFFDEGLYYCKMKLKLLSILFAAGVFSSLQAQTNKGAWMLGGSLNYSIDKDVRSNPPSTDHQIYRYQSMQFSPQIGRFVNDNLVLGLNLSLRGYTWTNHSESTGERLFFQGSSTYSVGGFTRKYFPISEQFHLFAQGNLSYFHQQNTNAHGINAEEQTNWTNGIELSGHGGIAYFPKKWLAIEGIINPISYSYNVRKENYSPIESSTKYHDFKVGFSTTSIFLGFNFFIGR